jgi:hypothetical protein
MNECPLCYETCSNLITWGQSGCTHLCCLLCALRHLHNQLSLDGNCGLDCATAGCPAPFISDGTLSQVLAYRPGPAAGANSLGEGATLRAHARVHAFKKSLRLEEAKQNVAGSGIALASCPTAACLAVLTLEGEDLGGTGCGVARQCDACGTQLCCKCGVAWALGVSHSGLTCSDLALQRQAAEAQERSAAAAALQPQAEGEEHALAGLSALHSIKCCPQCNEGISHYRGHACHHIQPGRGCPGCQRAKLPAHHWCYVCLSPWRSPSCTCNTYCDAACDCPDCPDCRPGQPCVHCDGVRGGCRVCSGLAGQPQAEAAWLLERRAATLAKVRQGWGGPRSRPLTSHPRAAATGAGTGADSLSPSRRRGQGGSAPLQPPVLQAPALIQGISRPAAPHTAATLAAALHALTTALYTTASNQSRAVLYYGAAEAVRRAVEPFFPAPPRAAAGAGLPQAAGEAASGGSSSSSSSSSSASSGSVPDAVAVAVLSSHAPHSDGETGSDAAHEFSHLNPIFSHTLPAATAAAGAPAAPAADPQAIALCESVLEFYAAAAGPPVEEGSGASSGSGSAELSYRRLCKVAAQGGFTVLQRIMALHGGAHTGVLRRALGVLAGSVRVAMAHGMEVPPEAEAAFDRLGGLQQLARVVGAAAAAGDGVIVEAGMKAMAGVRLHTAGRVAQAKGALPLLLALLTQRSAQGGGGSRVVSMAAACATIVALARALEVVRWQPKEGQGSEEEESLLGGGSSGSSSSGGSSGGGSGSGSGSGSSATVSPAAAAAATAATSQQLPHALCLEIEDAMHNALLPHHLQDRVHAGGGAGAGTDGGGALPLWEAVVLSGALRTLAWRARVVAWLPFHPFPPAATALIASLPVPPTNLAARAAVMRFRPRTLRMHLAGDEALRAQVLEAGQASAVPLWLKVLVAPLAAGYLLYAGLVWCLSEGVVLVLGWVLLGLGEVGAAALQGGALLLRWLLLPLLHHCLRPLASALLTHCLHPLARAAAAAAAALASGLWHYGWLPLRASCSAAASAASAALTCLHTHLLHPLALALWQLGVGCSALLSAAWHSVLVPLALGLQAALAALAAALQAAARAVLTHCLLPLRAALGALGAALHAALLQPCYAALACLHAHLLAPLARGLHWAALQLWLGAGAALSAAGHALCTALSAALSALGTALHGLGWLGYYALCWPLYYLSLGLRRGALVVGRAAWAAAEYAWVLLVAPVAEALSAAAGAVGRWVLAAAAAVGAAAAAVYRATLHPLLSAVAAASAAVREAARAAGRAVAASVHSGLQAVRAAMGAGRRGR